MPSGHTEKATINQRRPLTSSMVSLLQSLKRWADDTAMGPLKGLCWAELSTPEKNTVRALQDRGLIGFDDNLKCYYIKDAGRVALLALQPSESK